MAHYALPIATTTKQVVQEYGSDYRLVKLLLLNLIGKYIGRVKWKQKGGLRKDSAFKWSQ